MRREKGRKRFAPGGSGAQARSVGGFTLNETARQAASTIQPIPEQTDHDRH